ncbi:MAG: hypothetical protein ACJASL_000106 [Paraglaciecola sp.]|jgi:hypothetical protein
MPQAHISLFANISKTQIKETDTHFNIEGVPVTVDDAVMNGIHYSAENNKLGMPSIRDRVVTLSHPTTLNGSGADAYAGESLQKFYSGGHIETVYADSGTWKVNISIDKDILRAQDKKQDSNFYDSLANQQDIGVSTGLYAEIEPTVGKNAKGVDYEGSATKQVYNHLAMLDSSEPPAGGQSTFMRFNKESNDNVIVNLADYMPDSIPDTIYKVEDVGADDKTETPDEFNSLLAKLLALLGMSKLAGNTENKPQQNEENAMPDDIKKKMQALKDNGSYKDGMSDDDISNAFEKMGKKDDAPKSKDVAQNSEILNAIQALTEKFTDLETKFNAKDESVKTTLVDELKDLDTGLSVNALKGLEVEELQTLHNKVTGQTFALNGAFRQSQEPTDDYSDSFQNTGAK